MFRQRPEQKVVFVTQHGFLPLMDLLDIPKSRVCFFCNLAGFLLLSFMISSY